MTVVDLERRARARVPAPPGRQLDRQAAEAGQGAVHRDAQRARRRDRRPDRLFHGRGVLPPGRQCRHPRQGPGVDRRAGQGVRRRGEGAPRVRHDRGAGPERPREGDRPAARGRPRARSPSWARFAAARRPHRRRRGAVHRPHRLHRRGRFRGDRAGGADRRVLERAAGRGREAGRPGCARHPAPGSRHEPVRPGHGRERHAVRGRPGLDGRRWTRAATSSAAPRWKRSRRPARRAR